jgi:hypothetical protein
MQSAIDQGKMKFTEARELVSHSFGIPNGSAQAQLAECDCQAIAEILDAAAIRDPGQRRAAIKSALSAAAGRRQQQAAEDAQATCKRLECQAACRRVLEGQCGYTTEQSFAMLAVLTDGEKQALAAMDGQPDLNPADVQMIFDAAAVRVEDAEIAAAGTTAENAAESTKDQAPMTNES